MRFAPIFYFNCNHVLFVYIENKQKKFADFNKTFEFWWRQIFENSTIHKPSLGPLEVPHKIWAWSILLFWRLLETNKQTDKLNLYILYIQSYNQNKHIDLLQTQKFGLIYFPFNIQVISFLQGYIHFRDQACILKLKVLTLDTEIKNNCISSQKFRPMVVLKMACFSDSIFLFSCEKMYDPWL